LSLRLELADRSNLTNVPHPSIVAGSRLPCGCVLLANPCGVVGDVCFFVSA